MPQLMKYGLADFVANFDLIRANGLDIFLIKNDTVGAIGEVKHTLSRGGHAFKDAQDQAASFCHIPGPWKMGLGQSFWPILHQYGEIVNSTAEFSGE
jgi:hypothetical protein